VYGSRCVMNRLMISHCSVDCAIRPLQAQKAILAKVQKPVSRDKSWHLFNNVNMAGLSRLEIVQIVGL
jgi:hypothetical protein